VSGSLFGTSGVGSDFRSADLTGVNLQQSTFSSANFNYANLASTTLWHMVATSATFVGANFAGADFAGAFLDYVDISLADLRGSLSYPGGTSVVQRGTIGTDGTVTGFAFNAGETLRVRQSGLPATSTGAITGPGTIKIDAGGTLVVASLTGPSVSVSGTMSFGSNAATASLLSSISIPAGGFVDLSNDALVVQSTPESAIDLLIGTWYSGG
jgi:hypothetical protein